jgi:hypothetical protein
MSTGDWNTPAHFCEPRKPEQMLTKEKTLISYLWKALISALTDLETAKHEMKTRDEWSVDWLSVSQLVQSHPHRLGDLPLCVVAVVGF